MPEVGMEGQLKLKEAKVLASAQAASARRWLFIWRGRRGHARPRRFRRCRFHQPAAPDHPRHRRRRPQEARLRRRQAQAINPNVKIGKFDTRLTSANALELFKDFDIIVDGTDNFPTRYLVNDACVLIGKPNVYGSIFRFEGQASVFATRRSVLSLPLSEPPPPGLVPSCAEGGVLGHSARTGRRHSGHRNDQADSGHRRAADRPAAAVRRADMQFRELKLRKNPDCPVCGKHPTITKLIDYQRILRNPWRGGTGGE